MAYNQRPQFSQQSPRGSLRYQNHTFSHFLLDLLGCWTVLRHGESQIILYANSQVHLSPETINGLLAAQNCRNLIKRIIVENLKLILKFFVRLPRMQFFRVFPLVLICWYSWLLNRICLRICPLLPLLSSHPLP